MKTIKRKLDSARSTEVHTPPHTAVGVWKSHLLGVETLDTSGKVEQFELHRCVKQTLRIHDFSR